MRTEQEVLEKIVEIERSYEHVLTGSRATADVNAPRALMQISAEAKLAALCWVAGVKFTSRLKGTNT